MAYIERHVSRRRDAGGRVREILRCLKRYLAREVYFLLNPGEPTPAKPHTRRRPAVA